MGLISRVSSRTYRSTISTNMAQTVLAPPVLEFDPEYFTSQFEQCSNSEELDLAPFIQGYEGLVLLLNRLGSVFSFITSDIVAKLGLLRELRKSNLNGYTSLGQMMRTEEGKTSKTKKPSKTNPPTGTRQYQLLQRAMKMLYVFMDKIAKNECGGQVSQMAYEAYHASPLPNFHPWIVRNGVKIAVYTLPTRLDFFKIAAPEIVKEGTPEEAAIVCGYLERACVAMDNIYKRSNEMYEKADLLNLP